MTRPDPKPGGLGQAAVSLAAAAFLVVATAVSALADTTTPPTCPGDMTFSAWTSSIGQQFGTGPHGYIFASGSFCPDTADNFQKFLAQNPPKTPNTTVVLNSTGGDVDSALAMGRMIRQQKMWTQVGSQFPLMIGGNENIPVPAVPYIARPSAPPFPGYCYSACTETFMGGIYRTIDYASNYGVHRFDFTGNAPPDQVDVTQIESATILAYVTEMGISPGWLTYMVKQGPTNVTNLTMKELQQLNVVTPRWQTTWQITPLSNDSGFYLDGVTTDPWGTHDIAFTCYSTLHPAGAPATPTPTPPKPESGQATPPAPPGQPAQPAKPAPATTPSPPPLLVGKFAIDPGTRAKAQDLVGAVQQYVVEQGDQLLPLIFVPMKTPPTVDAANRLTTELTITKDGVTQLEASPYIGIAVLFDPKAKLPLRLLQFASDLNGTLLKQYAATCH